ncbi:hypothetical protein [Knoellia remsis]|uniref:hypothetical protein n=1 Tax=Knoellia remsis TaxID=407159 RepID=UPI000D081CC9|nr:hypothetical protein [Knoellia remsis]
MTPRGWADLTPAPATDGAWIRPLLGEFGTAGGLVGATWEAYAVLPDPVVSTERGSAASDDPRTRPLAALREVVAGLDPVGSCRAGLWEGYGGLFGQGAVYLDLHDGGSGPVPRVLSVEVEQAPRLELPHRGYVLFEAVLDDLAPLSAEPLWSMPPDLFWPDSQGWLVGSDTDIVATVVGGGRELVERVLADVPGAEAVEPGDGLDRWDERTLLGDV